MNTLNNRLEVPSDPALQAAEVVELVASSTDLGRFATAMGKAPYTVELWLEALGRFRTANDLFNAPGFGGSLAKDKHRTVMRLDQFIEESES